jgi:hypothetical protein
VGPARCAGAAPTGDVAHGARSGVPAHNCFDVPHFDRFKLKNFELKFKFASTKVVEKLTPSIFRLGRPVEFSTDLEIIILKVTDLYGAVKLFSRTLTEFLTV